MWEELKEKAIGNKVEWDSDGDCGEGTLTEIELTEDYVSFVINDPECQEPVVLGASREHAGISPSIKSGITITGGPAGWTIYIPAS